MLLAERKKKLAYAEKQLKATQRRLKRLMTAEKNWRGKTSYHRTKLAAETQAQQVCPVITVHSAFGLTVPNGRKFR